jgi:hypothetical protein
MIKQPIRPHTKYKCVVKIKIPIGSSSTNVKEIPLYYFPQFSSITIQLHPHSFKDTFSFRIQDNILRVTRIDSSTGWDHSHAIDIGFKTNASIMLFQEHYGNDPSSFYVTHYTKKILDSRDKYFVNHEWITVI